MDPTMGWKADAKSVRRMAAATKWPTQHAGIATRTSASIAIPNESTAVAATGTAVATAVCQVLALDILAFDILAFDVATVMNDLTLDVAGRRYATGILRSFRAFGNASPWYGLPSGSRSRWSIFLSDGACRQQRADECN